MDVLCFNDNNEMKEEGTKNSGSRFLCFREIKKLLRIVEIFFVLVIVTWVCTRLPFAVRISGEYFRQLLNIVVSPLFIFIVGNIIVITLFFKCRHHEIEACLDFVEVGPDLFAADEISCRFSQSDEETVYQDKQTILEEETKVVKVQRRSRSENFERTERCADLEVGNGCGKKLRRSETEKLRRVPAEDEEVVDEMSNEEFQRAIEDFIAKQIKFHQEEKLAIVLRNSNI